MSWNPNIVIAILAIINTKTHQIEASVEISPHTPASVTEFVESFGYNNSPYRWAGLAFLLDDGTFMCPPDPHPDGIKQEWWDPSLLEEYPLYDCLADTPTYQSYFNLP